MSQHSTYVISKLDTPPGSLTLPEVLENLHKEVSAQKGNVHRKKTNKKNSKIDLILHDEKIHDEFPLYTYFRGRLTSFDPSGTINQHVEAKESEPVTPNGNKVYTQPKRKPVKVDNKINHESEFFCFEYKDHIYFAHKFTGDKKLQFREIMGKLLNYKLTKVTPPSLLKIISKSKYIYEMEFEAHKIAKEQAIEFLRDFKPGIFKIKDDETFEQDDFQSKYWEEKSTEPDHLGENLKELIKKYFSKNRGNEEFIEFLNKQGDNELHRLDEVCIIASHCNDFNGKIVGEYTSKSIKDIIIVTNLHLYHKEETSFDLLIRGGIVIEDALTKISLLFDMKMN